MADKKTKYVLKGAYGAKTFKKYKNPDIIKSKFNHPSVHILNIDMEINELTISKSNDGRIFMYHSYDEKKKMDTLVDGIL